MSLEYQIKILRIVLAVTYFVTQLFGIFPYGLDKSSRNIKFNFYKFIYSILLPLVVVYNYFMFGVAVLASKELQAVVHSKTLGVITGFYALFIIVSFVTLYVGQHLKFKNLKLFYLKCNEVIGFLKEFSNESVDLRLCFVNFFIKTIAYDIYNLSVLYFHLRRSSNVLTRHPYLPIFLYTPVFAVRLNENLFYGGVLLLHIAYKQLNKTLLKIVTIKTTSEINQKYNTGKYCQLSDELDKFSKLHLKLTETIKDFNSIFDVQEGLWIILQLIGLIIRCFYQYIGVVHLLDSRANSQHLILLNVENFVILFFTWLEIFLTSYACDLIATEVCKRIVI